MKFPVGICILMGFWLNACTTEGEGNEFITKLASREEANEIMDYVNRQAFAFNQLENAAKPHVFSYDSSYFNRIERQKEFYTYDPAAGHFKRIVSVSVPYADSTRSINSVRIVKEYYSASPHGPNGLPSQPVYDFRSEISSYQENVYTYFSTGSIQSYQSYDSVVTSVEEMPFLFFTQLTDMNLSVHYETHFKGISKTSSNTNNIEARFSLDQVFQSDHYGTTTGSGRLKYSNTNSTYDLNKYDLNLTFEAEYDESIQDPMIGYLTMYLDLAGFRYKKTMGDWIPVD